MGSAGDRRDSPRAAWHSRGRVFDPWEGQDRTGQDRAGGDETRLGCRHVGYRPLRSEETRPIRGEVDCLGVAAAGDARGVW
jgi:hypothetical protein